MIVIKTAETSKEYKDFVNFPFSLYKDSKYEILMFCWINDVVGGFINFIRNRRNEMYKVKTIKNNRKYFIEFLITLETNCNFPF